MIKLICPNKKCPYHKTGWDYKGNSKFYSSCPKCMHKVNISKQLIKKKEKGLEPIKEV